MSQKSSMGNTELDSIAILYDSLLVRGGAEVVAMDLSEMFDGSVLCVDFCDQAIQSELSNNAQSPVVLGKHTSNVFFRHLQGIRNFTSKTAFLEQYQTVIFSGTNSLCAVANHPNGENILYCHTIPRFVYDLKDYWLARARWWQYPFLRFLIWYVKRNYEPAFNKMDVVISNSENVRQRILEYLGRDSIVIHPPCDTERFNWSSQGDYYLSASRIEPYKRVREIVLAFIQMPEKKLVVASGGSELEDLKSMAHGAENIRFTGWISEAELTELMGNAIATIYIPIDEDFGMSPVESMAAGKPVIGVAEGGLLETVLPEETGILIPADPQVFDIVSAVNRMTPDYALSMRSACEERAQLFAKDVFMAKIREVLGNGDRPPVYPVSTSWT